jgi:hypothetical protein
VEIPGFVADPGEGLGNQPTWDGETPELDRRAVPDRVFARFQVAGEQIGLSIECAGESSPLNSERLGDLGTERSSGLGHLARGRKHAAGIEDRIESKGKRGASWYVWWVL